MDYFFIKPISFSHVKTLKEGLENILSNNLFHNDTKGLEKERAILICLINLHILRETFRRIVRSFLRS